MSNKLSRTCRFLFENYQRFFFKTARPMCSVLEKEVKFEFNVNCLNEFKVLKNN